MEATIEVVPPYLQNQFQNLDPTSLNQKDFDMCDDLVVEDVAIVSEHVASVIPTPNGGISEPGEFADACRKIPLPRIPRCNATTLP